MIMRHILIVILCLTTNLSIGQINQKGLPFIRNYTPEEYQATDQNWAAVQDNRGLMYFGNNDKGVLEYDGRTWRTIPVPNNASVRSLAVDSIGTVYVGTMGDFGYLAPTISGGLEFVSLKPLITDSIGHFSDVLRIHFLNNKVYFFNRHFIFTYNGKSVEVININPDRKFYNLFSFLVNNSYYVGSYTFGLRELQNDSLVISPNGDFFKGNNLMGITHHSGHWINIVSTGGFYRYNQITGEVIDLTHKNKFYKQVLSDANPYHSILLADSTIGIPYIMGENYSFAQIDSEGNPKIVLNKAYGLLDETVTTAYQSVKQSQSPPVWLPLNMGIAKVNLHSQISRFSEESGIRGIILGVTEFNGRIVALTMSGVFYLDSDQNGLALFRQITGINVPAWTHLHFLEPKTGKKRLLVGTIPGGIYEIDRNFNAISLSNSPEFVGKQEHLPYSLHQSKQNPNTVYVGMSGALATIRWQNGKWENLGKVEGDRLKLEYRSMASGKQNELWLGTYLNGLTRLTLGGDILIEEFGLENGLSTLKDNMAFEVDNKVYFATSDGVYQYDESIKQFVPALLPGLNATIVGRGVSKVTKYRNGYALACYSAEGDRWIEIVKPNPDGTDSVVRQPFKSLPNRWTDALFTDSDSILWISISTELFSYNGKTNRDYNDRFNALIRRVIIKGDSTQFLGSFYSETPEGRRFVAANQLVKYKPSFSYRFNNITFEVASTHFEKEEDTEYSFILDGNDKEWSRWSKNPNPIYTNLSEGSYTFRVKARNLYGVESSVAEYSFSISAPWYRTILAFIGYAILLALLIWGIVVYNTRRLIAEKEHLEQVVKERTAEVVAQKEELEVQRDQIFHQNEEIKSSINYASRIQSALLTPIETINDMFDDYFILFLPRDIVSGDFYWHTQVGNRKICAISDCTGHGVPGGFMSMLGIAFLTQIMAKGERFTASQILDQLRAMIISSLHQTGKTGESKDGMDIALYVIDTDTKTIEFAGANNPMVIIRNDEIIQIKGDKMPIGIHVRSDTPFTNNVMDYYEGDVIYTFSDGFPDQFGGPDLRKFMIKNLKELFLEIHKKPMEEQREILLNALLGWQGDTDRIDDIVVMGLRL
jgi:serine phosphatase RsbU (regulator of sigma subunit)